MARSKSVVIRLSEEELAALEAMARAEHLPVGTFCRRLLMLEAKRREAQHDS